MRTRQFLPIRDICLGQFHCGRLIHKGEAVGKQILIAAFIGESKLLLFPCIDISVWCKYLCQIVFPVNRQIRDKEDLSVGIGGFLLDQSILLNQHLAVFRLDVLRSIKTEDGPFQRCLGSLFLFQETDRYLLSGVLPLLIIDNDRCILVAVGEIHKTRCIVQYIAVCCFLLHHIVLADRKIPQFRNAGIICGDGPDEVILLVVIRCDAVSCFDILRSIYFKGDRGQVAENILKHMLHGTLRIVQKGYLVQEFALLVDDQQRRRYFILHLHLLDLSSILYRKDHIRGAKVSVRSKLLPEDIGLAGRQALHHMRFVFHRCPAFDHITLAGQDRQDSAFQLASGCDITLREFKGCRLVLLHGAQLYHRYILSLIACVKGQDLIR